MRSRQRNPCPAARTSSSSSPTTSASPTSAATAAGPRSRRCSTGSPRTACASPQGYANSPVCSPTRFALMTGALPVPAARRRRGADPQRQPRQHDARPAAGAPDAAVAAARRRLPHGAGRQVASRLPAALRAAAIAATRSSSGRCRAASTTSATATRAARTTCGKARRSASRTGYLTDLISGRAVDYIGRTAAHGDARSSSACTTPRRTGRGRRATTRPSRRRGASNLFHLRRRQHPHLPAHDPPHGRRHRRASSPRSRRAACSTTRSSCSPATTAASASATTGRWSAARWTSPRAASACPWIAHWPARIAAGGVSAQPCMTMDWSATMLELGGADAASGLPARRRVPAARCSTTRRTRSSTRCTGA